MNANLCRCAYFLLLFSTASIATASPRTVGSGTVVTTGDEYVVVDDQGITTSGSVKIEQDGIAAFVTDGDSRITLNPGFLANPSINGKFHALATSDSAIYNQFYNLMVDADGDGIEDILEIIYGLNPFSNDANGDLDGDGVSNADEIAAGTDPMSDDSWYGSGAPATGAYGSNPIYIVDPDGAGHDLDTGDLTLN